MELKIHFGGEMKKIGDGEDYEYLGELGSKNVEWKIDDIVWDIYDGEMCELRSTNKSGIDVVEVFVEHECSEHIPGVIQLADTNRDDAECVDEEEEHSEMSKIEQI
ncbi:hypothetical protein YC2023_014549 [Brassica napus]